MRISQFRVNSNLADYNIGLYVRVINLYDQA